MATALARGWIKARLLKPEELIASDPFPEARKTFEKVTKAPTVEDNKEVVNFSEMLVLAVKPHHVLEVLQEIAPLLRDDQLVVSIAAGVTLEQLKGQVGHDQRLIRIMPNTPCLVGASASAFSPSLTAKKEDIELINRLLDAVGTAFEVPEKLLDAVTGLSGSGPAYVYLMIEALSDGGVRMGLPREISTALAAQTVLGSAKMLLHTNHHPGYLKDMVTSPGGTTIAGIHELEKAGVRGAFINAVEAATLRAVELGKQSKKRNGGSDYD